MDPLERRRAAHALGRAIRALPAIIDLSAALAALDPDDGARATAAVRALFDDDGWMRAALRLAVEALAADPLAELPFAPIDVDVHRGIVLFGDARVTISLGLIAVDRLAARKVAVGGVGSIGFPGMLRVMKWLRGGGASLSFWQAEPPGDGFTLAGAPPCRFVGRRAIADGELMIVDGRDTSWLLDHAADDMVLLQAEIHLGRAPLLVEYDACTLAPIAVSAGDGAASRLQMMATLLRRMARNDASEPLAALAGHRDFFVRWHMMRELLALDRHAAMPLLEAMAVSDPHPEVRATATRTLAVVMARAA